MKWTVFPTMLFVAVLIGGCADRVPVDDFCLTAKPRYYTAEELAVTPIDTIRRDVAQNEYGEAHCGWSPSKK